MNFQVLFNAIAILHHSLYLLCAKYCAKHFIWNYLVNFHNEPMQLIKHYCFEEKKFRLTLDAKLLVKSHWTSNREVRFSDAPYIILFRTCRKMIWLFFNITFSVCLWFDCTDGPSWMWTIPLVDTLGYFKLLLLLFFKVWMNIFMAICRSKLISLG